MAESTQAIVTAAGANLAIAFAKFAGAALTGSSAMVSEGAHSLVDTANQALLLLGLKRSERPADARHPFGYGREIYFWSFVVALLIFLAGGLYSLWEGAHKIAHPEAEAQVTLFGVTVPGVAVNLAILLFSIAVEGYSFIVAYRALARSGGSPIRAVRRSKDPSLFVVVVEDLAAVAGLVIALFGVALAYVLDMPALDGVASVGIGIVLVAMAGFLMVETHGLLIGEAADPALVESIRDLVHAEPSVRHLNEVLTQHLGPTDILVNISLDVDDAITGGAVESLVGRLDRAVKTRVPNVRRVFVEIETRPAPAV